VFEHLYLAGQQSLARKEEARQLALATESPSFTPVINARPPSTPKHGKSRFELLYDRAVRKREDQKRQQAVLFDTECTFEPRLVSKPVKSPASAASGANRLEELYLDGRRIEERRRQLSSTMGQEFSFEPRINRFSSKKGTARRDLSSLYPDPEDAKKKKERFEEMRRARELHGCTFKPKVLDFDRVRAAAQSSAEKALAGQSADRQPRGSRTATPSSGLRVATQEPLRVSHSARVYERLYERLREKRARQSQQSKMLDLKSPISARSTKSTASAASQRETMARLHQKGNEVAARRRRFEATARFRREKAEWEANRAECTFSPSIDKGSRKLASSHRGGAESASDIFARLFQSGVKHQHDRDIVSITEGIADPACTFRPRINKHSQILARRRQMLLKQQSAADYDQCGARREFSPFEHLLPRQDELQLVEEGMANAGAPGSVLEWEELQPSEPRIGLNLFISCLAEVDMRETDAVAFREDSWAYSSGARSPMSAASA